MLPVAAQGNFQIFAKFSPEGRQIYFRIVGPQSVSIIDLAQWTAPSKRAIEKAAHLMLNFLMQQHAMYPEGPLLSIVSTHRGVWNATLTAIQFAAGGCPFSPEVRLISAHAPKINALDSIKQLLEESKYTVVERWLREGFLLSLNLGEQRELFLWMCRSSTFVNDLLLFLRHGLLHAVEVQDIAHLIKDIFEIDLELKTVKKILSPLFYGFKREMRDAEVFHIILTGAMASPHRENLVAWIFQWGLFIKGRDRGVFICSPVMDYPENLSVAIRSGLLQGMAPKEFAQFLVYIFHFASMEKIDTILSQQPCQNFMRSGDGLILETVLEEALRCDHYLPLSDRLLKEGVLDPTRRSFYYGRLLTQTIQEGLDVFYTVLKRERLCGLREFHLRQFCLGLEKAQAERLFLWICISSEYAITLPRFIEGGLLFRLGPTDLVHLLIQLFGIALSFEVIKPVLAIPVFERLLNNFREFRHTRMPALLLEAAFQSAQPFPLVKRLLEGGICLALHHPTAAIWEAFVKMRKKENIFLFFPNNRQPFFLENYGIRKAWQHYATSNERIELLTYLIKDEVRGDFLLRFLLSENLIKPEEKFFLCNHLLSTITSSHYYSIALARIIEAIPFKDRTTLVCSLIVPGDHPQRERLFQILLRHWVLKDMDTSFRVCILSHLHWTESEVFKKRGTQRLLQGGILENVKEGTFFQDVQRPQRERLFISLFFTCYDYADLSLWMRHGILQDISEEGLRTLLISILNLIDPSLDSSASHFQLLRQLLEGDHFGPLMRQPEHRQYIIDAWEKSLHPHAGAQVKEIFLKII